MTPISNPGTLSLAILRRHVFSVVVVFVVIVAHLTMLLHHPLLPELFSAFPVHPQIHRLIRCLNYELIKPFIYDVNHVGKKV